MHLYESLLAYAKGETYPMHMPGHKRSPEFVMENPYAWDVTEVDKTDNLHHPEGIIRAEMDWLQKKYGTKETYLLVNGSTCGILAAISACCRRGDSIVVARNCHRSVYHAIFLLELKPIYLYPQEDVKTGILLGIQKEQVEEVLTDDVACVVITSPTYEGVMSDVQEIAESVHEKNIPLIVDEAHGAHFAWSDTMPRTAMEQGADLVVESLHKTLPALTQTALLHRASERVAAAEIERYLAIYETSSPSYVLMASISQCVHWLAEKGEIPWQQYKETLSLFEEQAAKWHYLRLWQHPFKEPSKLIIWTGDSSWTGTDLAEQLRMSYGMEVEMAEGDYVIAMTTIADTREGILKLADALTDMDSKMTEATRSRRKRVPRALVRKNCYEALYGETKVVPIRQSKGEIAAEYAFFYPPGIPFLVPGEEITDDVLLHLADAKKYGLTLLGLQDKQLETILVCADKEE